LLIAYVLAALLGISALNLTNETARSDLLSLTLTLFESIPFSEITWQEFQTHLLKTGNVERIIVSNKNIARFKFAKMYIF